MKKTTIKTLLLGLLFTFSSELKAQEKYDYALIRITSIGVGSSRIIVSTKEQQIETGIEKGATIYTALLNKINEFVEQGWMVYSNTEALNGSVSNTTYYLRRKK